MYLFYFIFDGSVIASASASSNASDMIKNKYLKYPIIFFFTLQNKLLGNHLKCKRKYKESSRKVQINHWESI